VRFEDYKIQLHSTPTIS